MEWRCEWCGKPHDEDDPPCDNCGHGTFERAVVQQVPTSESTTVWVCTECGREHPKHNPPCSRCGNPDLERRERTVDEAELSAPGYLDLVTPRYALGLVAALALAGVLLLGVAGVIDVPGLDSGVPEVADVPGNATALDGASFRIAEDRFVERLNELRSAAERDPVRRDDRLDAVAEFYNQRRVKTMAGRSRLVSDERIGELAGDRCGGTIGLAAFDVPIPSSARTPAPIGQRLAERSYEQSVGSLPADRGRIGVDMHEIRDDTVALTLLLC